ncbi:patatin-like phospholipase family protein [Tenacibaculum aquimarinum]|uniref:patatin-like phospholipase family protein n=1 Tax=Tenacibaculum aquimarinum TaxID=2910675 RepID=UPI001F0A2DF9|nr:patatin-like phospholipase family protein [Tenacibaculum aquimarinum]MCH3884386.1 patatin-like phospholipase family protein [Tenacibaculum aquimarinum]
MRKILLLLIATLFTFSCKVYQKVNLPAQKGISGYSGYYKEVSKKIAKSNQEKLEVYKGETQFYPNSEKLNWGLAMSGGGIRSAAVNIGAIKALYDMELLDSIQIMSSVSGGSYALGWFFSNETQNQDMRLGEAFLDNKFIISQICNLRKNANMMRVPTMLYSLFSSPNKAFMKYEESIQRTFINDNSKYLKLNKFQSTGNNKKPYFIINSTIQSKKNSDWLSRVYEFTPYHQGNPEVGLLKNDNKNSITLERAVTISGAAINWKLLQKHPNQLDTVKSTYFPLSDGGKSENLGAISLIRRGIKNIIIIDAEHNKNLSFDGYKILKEQLRNELSLNFSIPEIDNFISNNKNKLDKSVYKGTVKSIYLDPNDINKPLELNIFYMKMSLPESIESVFSNQIILNEGNNLKTNLRCDNPNILKKESDFYSLSASWTKSYSNWLNKESKWRLLNYKFPHTTTADQSFYTDQFSAFVGLGYIQTTELKDLIKD